MIVRFVHNLDITYNGDMASLCVAGSGILELEKCRWARCHVCTISRAPFGWTTTM